MQHRGKTGRQGSFYWTVMRDLVSSDYLSIFCGCLLVIYGANAVEGFLAMVSVQGVSG